MPMGAFFRKMLAAKGLSGLYEARYVQYRWVDIVGKTLAARTRVRGVRKKTLYLQVLSGPLRYELQNKKKKLLTLIEEKVGKGVVEEVVFQ